MISPWYAQRQRSNSAAAPTMTDAVAVVGRAGFSIVVTGMTCRSTGSATPNTTFATATDGASSSFVLSGFPNVVGNVYAVAQLESQAHRFGEGLSVTVTVSGNGDATTVGYTLDYHYEPVFPGFTGI